MDGLVFSSGQKYPFCIIQTTTLNPIFGNWMNFLKIWFRSLFSTSRRVFLQNELAKIGLIPNLENLKLRNWCFYCVKNLSNLGLIFLRCICNKGVRSRQEYINCFQLLTFSFLKTNGSEILESHFEIFLMCTQSNP